MSTLLGWLRKRALVTPPEAVTFPVRGFETHAAPARQALETAALHFTIGFEFGIEHRTADGARVRLECLQREYRGFAYEGAVMALALRDALSPRPGNRRTERFLAGPAAHHAFLGCLGIGFALARMPRTMWRRAVPDQRRAGGPPTLAWAAIDGYGFHQAFFRTRHWVDRQYVPRSLAWRGDGRYTLRVIDQGLGRALWFVGGGNVARVSTLIGGFAPTRRADLWSGAGLAATYAGGVPAESLAELTAMAGPHRADLAQGAVLAAKARLSAGLTTAHTSRAVEILCGCSVESAARVADEAMIDITDTVAAPAYEVFRERIRQAVR